MRERFDALRLASVMALAACGGMDDGSALIRSAEALSCQTDTDCHVGYACTHFLARSYCEPMGAITAVASPAPVYAPSAESDRNPADPCADGECEAGESEPGPAYSCAPPAEEDQQQADAGASSDAGSEDCRQGGADCEREVCADAGGGRDCREDTRDAEGEDDSEDRRGPNRGQH